MKTFGKNLLPEIHFNSIDRDLFLVVMAGLLVAIAIVTFGVMIASHLA